MKISKLNVIENLSLISFVLYFVFNFYDRSIANIFLLITLFLCIVNYKNLYVTLKSNIRLVLSVIVFSIFITLNGLYHNSPISELDNYYRFLLLLPLILISLNDSRMTVLLSLCAVVGLIHAFSYDAFYGISLYPENIYRYAGTSNTAITYSNMCATLLMICLYYIFYKKNYSHHLIFSTMIFLVLFMITETRGPIIGLVLSLIYLSYSLRNSTKGSKNFMGPLLVLSIFLISIILIPNPIGERMKLIGDINFSEPLKIKNVSLRERAYYLNYAIDELKEHYISGVGPQNVTNRMQESLTKINVDNITPRDHVHNEFLDVSLKFGLLGLILLFVIYFHLTQSKNTEDKVLINILMIMLIFSQMTQSHFSHHQAITFYIALFYLLQTRTSYSNKIQKN